MDWTSLAKAWDFYIQNALVLYLHRICLHFYVRASVTLCDIHLVCGICTSVWLGSSGGKFCLGNEKRPNDAKQGSSKGLKLQWRF